MVVVLFYFPVMTVETDLREIKDLLFSLNRKIDMLIEDREALGVMMFSERALRGLKESPISTPLKILGLSIIEGQDSPSTIPLHGFDCCKA
ncbi:MAG: hypothetical protein ACP5PQ_05240 [Thermoproteota archaeon]